MVLYHLDRNNILKPGQSINPVAETAIPDEIKNLKLLSCFDGQLSAHGLKYLDLKCPVSPCLTFPDGSIAYWAQDVAKQLDNSNMHILEFTFEMVRKAYFPQHPSRFTSLFAVAYMQDFLDWTEICTSADLEQMNILKLDLPENPPCFDSRWLKGGLIHGRNGNKFHIAFSAGLCFDLAFKYWSQIPSDNPRWEYLVQLPIDRKQISHVSFRP